MSERVTVQKQIILDTLKSMDTHPSVDELYAIIHKSHPAISKATVYRNVKQLANKGVILQIAVANDVSRYDGCVDFHYHFICNNCGRVLDVYTDYNDDNEKLKDTIQGKYGYKVDNIVTSLVGTCLNCADTNKGE